MMSQAISVENLSKRYEIGAQRRHPTLRDLMSDLVSGAVGALTRNGTNKEYVWALKDASFEVEQGARLGIVGANGAGKSTLLKILAQITEPTTGRVKLFGRVGSLLEVGTGFHPELTGRENIYLNGSILGMQRSEINRTFDEIVAFAEIERFLETPVKHYSTGMYMRLAFAVAAHLQSEILLVDEVLAVGDADFQKRCLGKMSDVATQGRTVLFISHSMMAVSRLCERCIWIDQGRIQAIGPTEEVLSKYILRNNPSGAEYKSDVASEKQTEVVVSAVRIRNREGAIPPSFDARQPCFVEIEHEVFQPVQFAWIGFTISTTAGVDIVAAADGDDETHLFAVREPGKYISVCELPAGLFNAGRYLLSAYAAKTMAAKTEIFSMREHVIAFDVDHPAGIGSLMPTPRVGVISPTLNWKVRPAGEPEPVNTRTAWS